MTDSGSYPSDEAARWARLTDKQRACLDLLLERQTSKQIARRLNISKQAVDLRLTTARDVLGAANRDETAILYARLRSTYDRIPCDPVILPPRPELVPSDFPDGNPRSEEHTSELQYIMRNPYAVFCLKKKNTITISIIHLREKIQRELYKTI